VGERRRAVKPGYKRLSVQLPEELLGELYAVAGRSVSSWIEKAVGEKLEEERRRRLLRELPTPLRERLVKTAGGEDAAVHLLTKVIEKGLAEIEEEMDEELVQEVLGEAHKRERLSEVKRGQSSLSGRG
jgi:Mg/Co/Ni transporter MgtE